MAGLDSPRPDSAPWIAVRYGDHPDQWMQRWDPDGLAVGSVVLLHGGYWRQRYGLDLMEPLASHLAGRRWRVWNVEYRRVGGEPLPGGGESEGTAPVWDPMSADVLAALETLAGESPRSPGDYPAAVGPSGACRPVVIGHSAGGHLALWAAAASPVPTAVVALAPVADLDEADRRSLSDGAVRELLGGDRDTVPERYADASPSRRLPLGVPQLVVHGPSDEHVPFELAADYVDAATKAGDLVELHRPAGVDHFDVIDPSHEVWRVIDRWLTAFSVER